MSTTNTTPVSAPALTPEALCLQVIVGLQQLFAQAMAKALADTTKESTNMVLNLSRQLGVWFDRQTKLSKSSSTSKSKGQNPFASMPAMLTALAPVPVAVSSPALTNPSTTMPKTPAETKPSSKTTSSPAEKPAPPKEMPKPLIKNDPLMNDLMAAPGGILAWAQRQARQKVTA